MPKQIWKIDQFHGGLNSNSDPRDIADNELSTVTGLMVDEVGKIRTMGATTEWHSSASSNFNGGIQPGYGLFHFAHDYLGAGVNLPPYEIPSSYIAFWDDDNSEVAILENLGGTFPVVGTSKISLGGSGGKPCFYYVDGALRVSDGNFGANNTNKWYGHIKRTWFPDINSGYAIDDWYEAPQKLLPPIESYYDKNSTITNSAESGNTDIIGTAGSGIMKYETRLGASGLHSSFQADGGGNESIARCVFTIYYIVNEVYGGNGRVTLDVKCGTRTDDGWQTAQTDSFDSGLVSAGVYTKDFSFNFDSADTDTNDNWSGANDKWSVEVTAYTGTSVPPLIQNAVVYEGAGSTIDLDGDSSSPLGNGYVTGNNVCILWDWASSGGSGWNNAGNTGAWNVGATFIYDEVQESQITKLVDETNGWTVGMEVPDSGAAMRPAILLAIADPTHDGAGDSDGTTWSKRVTGCNIYIQDINQDTTQPWYLQYSVDFLTGKLKVEDTQKEYDALLHSNAAHQSYYYWHISETELSSPSSVITYEVNSGLNENERSIISKYKTAVVANRRTYIGGIEVEYEDVSTEVMSDAMIKSPVNKFDVFPLSRIIEASVRDGDEIVKLEEYADRILQFKKNKMHLINISQDIEFLEDTFMYKGVSHPAATCKTDFGIAWVNKHGCYLYDGQNVVNLFEKDGRQMIKESEWKDFVESSAGTSLDPMIGYIPQKRQLLVISDVGSNMNEPTESQIYLYDMVTQSWVTAEHNGTVLDSNWDRSVDNKKTNFSIDWNGDLAWARSAGDNRKWDDTSQDIPTGGLELYTKDIDFGQPAQRKKIYKVYITYKCTGDSGVRVQYGVDGEPAGITKNFSYSYSTYFGSGTLDDSSGVWQVAELKPGTSSEANNKKSFRLRFWNNAEVPSDFEINDISIVYRLKGIK